MRKLRLSREQREARRREQGRLRAERFRQKHAPPPKVWTQDEMKEAIVNTGVLKTFRNDFGIFFVCLKPDSDFTYPARDWCNGRYLSPGCDLTPYLNLSDAGRDWCNGRFLSPRCELKSENDFPLVCLKPEENRSDAMRDWRNWRFLPWDCKWKSEEDWPAEDVTIHPKIFEMWLPWFKQEAKRQEARSHACIRARRYRRLHPKRGIRRSLCFKPHRQPRTYVWEGIPIPAPFKPTPPNLNSMGIYPTLNYKWWSRFVDRSVLEKLIEKYPEITVVPSELPQITVVSPQLSLFGTDEIKACSACFLPF